MDVNGPVGARGGDQVRPVRAFETIDVQRAGVEQAGGLRRIVERELHGACVLGSERFVSIEAAPGLFAEMPGVDLLAQQGRGVVAALA